MIKTRKELDDLRCLSRPRCQRFVKKVGSESRYEQRRQVHLSLEALYAVQKGSRSVAPGHHRTYLKRAHPGSQRTSEHRPQITRIQCKKAASPKGFEPSTHLQKHKNFTSNPTPRGVEVDAIKPKLIGFVESIRRGFDRAIVDSCRL